MIREEARSGEIVAVLLDRGPPDISVPEYAWVLRTAIETLASIGLQVVLLWPKDDSRAAAGGERGAESWQKWTIGPVWPGSQ